MDRTKFYTVEVVDDIEELDYLYNSLSNFTMTYDPSYYRIEEGDLLRPDMISYKSYGTVRYWWIICYVNGIEDCFHDLSLGQLLIIPNLIDLYNFYKKYRVR
jgi:hypothetical protein